MEYMLWVWLGVVAAALIIEFISMDLTSIWFAIAGIVSLILSAIGGISWEIQLIVFIILSAILVIFVRRITRKVLLTSKEDSRTNVDSLVGKRTRLLSSITEDRKGTISINGVTWGVKSQNDIEIEEGNVVEVVSVEGNTFVVKKVNGAIPKAQAEESQDDSKMEEK